MAQQQPEQQQGKTWQFGPVWGAINGLLVAVVAAQVTTLFGLPLWLPTAAAAGAAFLSGGVWLHSRLEQRRTRAKDQAPVRTLIYAVMCMSAAGVWATWVAAFGHSWLTYLVLAGGTLVLASVAPLFAPTVPEEEPQRVGLPGLPAGPVEDPLVVRWRTLINQALNIKNGSVSISGIEHWNGATGYTVRGEFPLGQRITYKQLAMDVEGLAGALRLPNGCPIKADAGPHQGSFVLKVSTVNDLDNVQEFPMAEVRQRSVVNPFPLGKCRDARLAEIEVYQSSALVVGMRGSGKTVVLHGMTAHLVQCTDAVVWIADLNGGSMGAPWTAPYATGAIKTPVVDWVATSASEAIRMAAVGLEIAKDRKARYQHLLTQHNTDVLPVSAGLPAIVIIVDEGAEAFGEDATEEAERAATMLRELQRIGRAMCVNVILSSLRGTRDCVPPAVRKQTDVKIVMRCSGDEEIAYVFDWGNGIRNEDLTAKGAGFFRYQVGVPENFKGWRLLPKDIARIAALTEAWRPQLDEPAQLVGGPTYAQRWTRDETWLWVQALAGTTPLAVRPPDVEANVRGDIPTAVMAAGLDRFAQQFKADLAAQAAGTAAPVALVDMVDRVTHEVEQAPAAAPETLDEFVCRLIFEAGGDGIQSAEIIDAVKAAGLTQRRQTVHEAIARAEAADLVTVPAGKWARWTATDKLRDLMAGNEAQAAA